MKIPPWKNKTEIDHLLTNHISLVSDNRTLSDFLFSSDHQPVASALIFREKRYPSPQKKVLNKNNLTNLWIPIHKREGAITLLAEMLKDIQWDQIQPDAIQVTYDFLESSIKEVLRQFGVYKKNLKTDDKLSIETKDLIQKRAPLESKVTLNVKEQIELIQLKKTIKKKVREDQRNFNELTAREIIESTWSTRKVKRVLANNRKLLPKLLKEKGEAISDRE